MAQSGLCRWCSAVAALTPKRTYTSFHELCRKHGSAHWTPAFLKTHSTWVCKDTPTFRRSDSPEGLSKMWVFTGFFFAAAIGLVAVLAVVGRGSTQNYSYPWILHD